MSGSPTLVVYGDALVDVSARVARLPQPGEDALVDDFALYPGGSAANCAAVSGRLGGRVAFAGVIGDDLLGEMARRDVASHGVDLSALKVVDGGTGATVTMIDASGQPAYLSYRGVAESVSYGSLPDGLLREGDHLHVSGYSFQTAHSRETARALMALAREAGARVSLDPSYHFAREVGEAYPDAMEGLDYLFPSEEEARLMTGLAGAEEAAVRLRESGTAVVALKRGDKGSLLATETGVTTIPACAPPRVVDMAGAGDAFAGGFLLGIQRGLELEDAARVGNAVAALVIGARGAHTAAPTVGELLEFARTQADEGLLAAVALL